MDGQLKTCLIGGLTKPLGAFVGIFMKTLYALFCTLSILLLLSCSEEPPAQEVQGADTLEPAPYLYKPPTTATAGIPTAKLKKEDLAEAFVSRLSTHAPAGIVVMQQEKLVLEEYYELDSTALLCTGSLFPAYTGALLGSLYKRNTHIPRALIPLQALYPNDLAASAVPFGSIDWPVDTALQQQQTAIFQQMIENKAGLSQGLAAEEYLFEPLQIDDYKWEEGSLCLHPHAVLQLGSLWVRRGRWANKQLLPDLLIQHVLAPAYAPSTGARTKAYGWNYYRLMAKGRKQPVLYWKGDGFYLFLLPEVEAVALLQGGEELMPDAWEWMQNYLIPSLTP